VLCFQRIAAASNTPRVAQHTGIISLSSFHESKKYKIILFSLVAIVAWEKTHFLKAVQFGESRRA
jgi:hypothetical protein